MTIQGPAFKIVKAANTPEISGARIRQAIFATASVNYKAQDPTDFPGSVRRRLSFCDNICQSIPGHYAILICKSPEPGKTGPLQEKSSFLLLTDERHSSPQPFVMEWPGLLRYRGFAWEFRMRIHFDVADNSGLQVKAYLSAL